MLDFASIFDLKNDVVETIDVLDQHPDIVVRLQKAAEAARADLGDKLTQRSGTGTRPVGRLRDADVRLKW